jgi:hypothetical protein
MPYNPHNVDICVTCVSDKPPQLPLREELPSLGIEVVYNAHGVGAKATYEESKRVARNLRKHKKLENKNNGGSVSKSESLPGIASPSKEDPPEERTPNNSNYGDDHEDDDANIIPTALSYSSYQRSLELQMSKDTSRSKESAEANSLDTDSTMQSEVNENHPSDTKQKARIQLFGRKAKKDDKSKPPTTVEIPTPSMEELAIREAFKAFSTVNNKHNDVLNLLPAGTESKADTESVSPRASKSKGTTSSNELSSSINPSTLTSQSGKSKTKETLSNGNGAVKIVFSGKAKDDFPDLLLDSEDATDNEDVITNHGRDSASGKEYYSASTPNQPLSQVPKSNLGLSPRSGNIKVKLFSHGLSITEMYDLTELSDDEGALEDSQSPGQDHLTTSSKGANRLGYTENETSHFSSPKSDDQNMGFRVPEAYDGFGHLVLDLSYVYEEDGPGSPLVYSPTPEMDDVHSPSSRTDRNSISPSHSPASYRVHFDVKKKEGRRSGSNDMKPARAVEEGREDCNVLESPEMSSTNGREKYSSPTEATQSGYGTKSLFDDTSFHDPSRHRDGSSHRRMLKIATAYRSGNVRPSGEINSSETTARDSEIHKEQSTGSPLTKAQSHKVHSPRSDSSSHSWREASVNSYPSPNRPASPRLVPALRKNLSRESDAPKLPKVSFSQDIEERYFDEDDDFLYKEAMADVKSSLAAIVHEERDLTEPLPSALSREADEAFRSLAEKLGMDDDGFRSPELMLVEALSYGDPIPFDFEDTLKRSPDLAMERLPDIDSYALHAACLRRFPERFGVEQRCRVKDLVDDVTLHQKLIGALVAANPSACKRVDENGDLPVHIMARRLMEWEAKWYQKVYENAKREETEEENGRGITRLYQTMSECINSLLSPVSQDESLCLQSGSVGRLLPLHIAAIFTVSYDTLRALLEAYPDAASVKCDLSNIRTFIPDHSIPLELHDRLSTDFPKWEIQRIAADPREELTQANLDKTYGTTGGMRRSDLMFAFSPNVLPYRKESDRIRRMETRIRNEILENEASGTYSLSRAAQLVWVWMCQFENLQDETDDYSENIRRIIYPLSARALRFLATLPTATGKPVVDRATSKCTDVILERLNKRAESEIPVPTGSLSTGFNSTERSFLLRQFDEDMASRFCLQGRGFVGPLCRTLFNITEAAFPSSFVLLPYKLVKDREGRLGLESAKAAKVAMKFAEFLLILTSPTCIVQTLDRKVMRFLGQGLVDEFNDEGVASHANLKELLNQFLSVYESGPAYFYFLDEYKGTPIVSENNGIYPFVVSDAADVVRKVFPLMLTGMILMRGEKAIPILAETLLDKNVKLVQPHWIKAAKDLVAYMFSSKTEWTRSLMHDLYPLRDPMLEFIHRGPTETNEENGYAGLSSEWVVEASLIRMVVEMHDPKHTYSGLQPRRAGLQVMWTTDPVFLFPDSNEYQMQIDFKSVNELKRLSKTQKEALAAEKKVRNGDSAPEVATDGLGRRTGYEELFEDLALTDDVKCQSSGDSEESSDMSGSDQKRPKEILTTMYQQPITSRYSSFPASCTRSVLDFDDSLDLDDVLKLRIQLDEQEAKLDFLREKIEDLEDAERELIHQEDKITGMIDEILNQRDHIVKSPSRSGLSKARSLLLRICDLEERVLCREVEVGQLKNDITCFELEASVRRETHRVNPFFGDELDVDDSTIHSSAGSVASSVRSL